MGLHFSGIYTKASANGLLTSSIAQTYACISRIRAQITASTSHLEGQMNPALFFERSVYSDRFKMTIADNHVLYLLVLDCALP